MTRMKYSICTLVLVLCLTGCSSPSSVTQFTTDVESYITNIRENLKETVDSFSERATKEKESAEELWGNRQLGEKQEENDNTEENKDTDEEVEDSNIEQESTMN